MITITSFTKKPSGYGHYKIIVRFDESTLPGSDAPAPTNIEISYVTNDMRAIDGMDGGDQTLAKQCVRANDYDTDDFDFSALSEGETD